MSDPVFGIGELSRDRFVELYIDIGEREGVLLDPELDEARFVLIDQGHEHDLAPVYERYLTLPQRSRRYFLIRALRGAGFTPRIELPTFDSARGRLLPRLRSDAYLDLARLDDTNRGRPAESSFSPLAGELNVCVVIDGEDGMTPVNSTMLAAWNMSFDEVRSQARENLAARDDMQLGALSKGLWLGPWDDPYAASRLLLFERLNPCPNPVVAVPNRDTLFVADPKRPEALSALVGILADTDGRGFALCRQLLRLHVDGDTHRLAAWAVPAAHPAAGKYRRLRSQERAKQYAEQQWLLQEAEGDAVYVPSAELDEHLDGSVSLRALWTEGVDALLPEVDRLHLLRTSPGPGEGQMLAVPFEALCDLDGVLAKTGHLLPRWRTHRFPTAAELRDLAVPVERDPVTRAVSEPGREP